MGTGTEFENVRVVFAGVQQRIRDLSPYSLPLQGGNNVPYPNAIIWGLAPNSLWDSCQYARCVFEFGASPQII
jgi:hypothetical protein